MRILETYQAGFFNETPARVETITEIADSDGSLLCYAEPDKARRIVESMQREEGLRYMLWTLINLHDGLAHGGKGITDADWQQTRELLKS